MARWNVYGAAWTAKNPLTTEDVVREVIAQRIALDDLLAPYGDPQWYPLEALPEIALALRAAQGMPPPRASELPTAMPVDPESRPRKRRTLRPSAPPPKIATKPPPSPKPRETFASLHEEAMEKKLRLANVAQVAAAVAWGYVAVAVSVDAFHAVVAVDTVLGLAFFTYRAWLARGFWRGDARAYKWSGRTTATGAFLGLAMAGIGYPVFLVGAVAEAIAYAATRAARDRFKFIELL